MTLDYRHRYRFQTTIHFFPNSTSVQELDAMKNDLWNVESDPGSDESVICYYLIWPNPQFQHYFLYMFDRKAPWTPL